MAETTNTSQMAELLSNEIFSELKWQAVGPTNINWKCEDPKNHDVKTHPSDVVFYYTDPYSRNEIYLNFDLKSYASGSITKSEVQSALESLSRQVACADASEEWQQLYVSEDASLSVYGVLFIYNHDGAYDKDFRKFLSNLKTDKLVHPPGTKLFVIGPQDIFWIDNIRLEIERLRGKSGPKKIPSEEYCQFFYPNLERKTNINQQVAKSLIIENLLSNFIILEFQRPNESKPSYLVFSRGSGEETDEYLFLLNYFRQYQMLDVEKNIEIITIGASDSASSSFEKAKQDIVRNAGDPNSSSNFSEEIQNITFRRLNTITTSFSTIEIGMNNGQ